MWKNLFKKEKATDTEVLVEEGVLVEQEPITSKTIQNDIQLNFNTVLEQFNLMPSKESYIEELGEKLKLFKKDNEHIYKKIENLKAVGLTNTPTAKVTLAQLEGDEKRTKEKIVKLHKEISTAEKLQQTIGNYKLQYPGYKFVPKEVMVQVMKKYGLVMSEAFCYAREIPDDALETISKFSKEIKNSEKFYQLKVHQGYGYQQFYIDEKPKPLKLEKTVDFWMQEHHGIQLYDTGFRENILKEFSVSKFKMVAPETHFKVPTFTMGKHSSRSESAPVEVPLFIPDPDTCIMKMNTSQIEELNKHNREVLDPIACLEVDLGFIVLAAWDEEADIPEIKNEMLN